MPTRDRRRPGRADLLAAAVAGFAALATFAAGPAGAQPELRVTRVSPARHALAAPADSEIVIEFDRAVSEDSVNANSLWAFGRWSGVVEGDVSFGNGGRTMTLTPARRFSAGETVMVILPRDVRAIDGASLRNAGYAYQFWIRSRGAGFHFEEIDRFSTRSAPEISTRSYGGFGSDLDRDGFLDLTIVNEDTNDLRTFLNRGDRSGRFHHGFLRPPARTEEVPSPSEPTDFDRDGDVDVVVANTQGDSVSVFLGNGDGTFGAASNYFVGGEPRGVTVLDADGDGDVDIAATSFFEGTVTVLYNDGSGGFADSSTFGTQRGERAIAAGDMDDDGILDLVVGALTAGEVDVYLAAGNGTFTLASSRSSGGETWMLVLGDVDGDGHEDVAAVNSDSNNAAILAGDGSGALGPPRLVATDDFPLATDLADLDGDGDLDWMTSSFFGNWQLWRNDGLGGFTLARDFPAPQAASCTLPLDVDNDGVLDLVLIDELEDELVVLTNPAVLFSDDFESGDTGAWTRSRTRGSLRVTEPGLGASRSALEVLVDAAARPSYLQSNRPSREAGIRVGLDLDVAGLDLQDDGLEILRIGSGKGQARLVLERSGRGTRAVLYAREAGGFRKVGGARLRSKGALRLDVEWSSASGPTLTDGRAALRSRGKLRAVASDLANHGAVVKRVRLGLPSGSPATARGSFLLDNYRSTR